MKKIQSFTVLELIISLLISSIVISVSYYVYFLFSTQLLKQQQKNAAITELHMFQKIFQTDFDNASTITDSMDNSIIILSFDNKAGIKYYFDNGNIIRGFSVKNDTFNFSGKVDKLTLLDDSVPLIQKIELEVIVEKEKIDLLFSKQYSSRQITETLANE